MARPRIEDEMRLGSDVAGILAKMSRKQRSRFVRSAHKRGYTVRGALANVPDPMRERTRESLRRQAEQTVAAAYKPAEHELGQQESRINALDAKRQRDEAAFREWLTAETGKINAQAEAADKALRDRAEAIQGEVDSSWATAQAQARQAAAATPGNVSNPAQSTALDFSAAARRAVESVGNARQSAERVTGIGSQRRAMTDAAMLAASAAAEARRVADTWAALGKVGDARQKLQFEKAADAAQEIQRLLDGEIEKAQANMELDAAYEKLGLDREKFQFDQQEKDRRFELDRDKAATDEEIRRAKIDVDYERIKAADGRAAADRALRERLEQGKRDRTTSADRRRSDTQFETVETVLGQLKDLHVRFPKGKSGQGRTLRQILRERGYTDVVIDVAEDLRRHNGALSKRGRQKAQALGILNPAKYWGSA